MTKTQTARYNIGQVIRHRLYAMRGVIYDVETSVGAAAGSPGDDPGLVYRLFAEDDEIPYEACIAEQDLLPDETGEPVSHPAIGAMFELSEDGDYRRRRQLLN